MGALRGLALASGLLGATLAVGGEPAAGDAPSKQGWWSRWQDTPATTIGTAVLPILVPPPPTGEEGGLTVALGPDGPQAVAAMFFESVDGADATLYLKTAKSGGQEKPFALPQGASVVACAAMSPWEQKSNGPWREAPTWRQDDCAPGTVTPGGTAMFWTLPATLQDGDGNYDIVLVPTFRPPDPRVPGSAPFMASFAVPDAGTFVAEDAPEPETTTTSTVEEETTTTTEPEEIVEETDPFVSYEVGGDPGGSGTGVPVVTTTPPRRQPTTLVAFDPPVPDFIPIPDTRAERIMAVSLLFFMAVALWWLGGNPARMPRLIGALAGDGRPARPIPASERGVGRFARPRVDSLRPPRL